MSVRIACDRTGCTEAEHEDSPQMLTWFMVQTMDPSDDSVRHFCCRDHAVFDLMAFEVSEGIGKEEAA